MKKLIKITEPQLKKVIENIISEQSEILKEGFTLGADSNGFTVQQEDYPKRELTRKKTGFRKRDFDPYPRESDLESLFGPYADDIPPQVYQHLRKNPQQFIAKFKEIYGKKY